MQDLKKTLQIGTKKPLTIPANFSIMTVVQQRRCRGEFCGAFLIPAPARRGEPRSAPTQHELAPVFATANIAADHNQLTMEMMERWLSATA